MIIFLYFKFRCFVFNFYKYCRYILNDNAKAWIFNRFAEYYSRWFDWKSVGNVPWPQCTPSRAIDIPRTARAPHTLETERVRGSIQNSVNGINRSETSLKVVRPGRVTPKSSICEVFPPRPLVEIVIAVRPASSYTSYQISYNEDWVSVIIMIFMIIFVPLTPLLSTNSKTRGAGTNKRTNTNLNMLLT